MLLGDENGPSSPYSRLDYLVDCSPGVGARLARGESFKRYGQFDRWHDHCRPSPNDRIDVLVETID